MSMDKNYYEGMRKDISLLLPDKILKVLEVGCGTGNTLVWLKNYKQCTWVGGIEISPTAAAQARAEVDAVYEGDIEHIDLPIASDSLDLILCLDVLEHLINPWNVMLRLQKMLKPGGALIASIPNVRNRKVLFPLIFKGKWDYTDAGILDKTHLRFFVRETAVILIESSGLKVDIITATGLGRSRRSKFVNSLIPSFIRSLFEYQYLIRAIR